MTIEDQFTPSDLTGCGGGATRRHALVGLAAAAGALCAGCSSSSSNGSSGAPSTSQPAAGAGSSTSSSSSPASSDSTSGSAAMSSGSTSSSGAAGSGGTVLAPVASVPVGGGKILSDKQIVLTQPTAGDIKAFSAVCTHQGCTVGSVDNSLITCPCHGSQYKITDGSVVTGPAARALAPHQVKVENGQVLLIS
ncbi:hypothetical protein GCM10009839_26010 [Catenulispora yoronensis]|uniref:Cytochrome bc1 complex Rieske iron-sulfur subunit n=1 Tax=Catenulispora yoronensis TaxID=450799 RepID=A0ABN2U0U7_9ACTN